MRFFIPHAQNAEQEQSVYNAIKQFLQKEANAEFSERRIFSLRYTHDQKKYYAEVGQEHSLTREPVFAILHEPTRHLYHVCTTTRGVVRGMSILVGEGSVQEVVDFEV